MGLYDLCLGAVDEGEETLSLAHVLRVASGSVAAGVAAGVALIRVDLAFGIRLRHPVVAEIDGDAGRLGAPLEVRWLVVDDQRFACRPNPPAGARTCPAQEARCPSA